MNIENNVIEEIISKNKDKTDEKIINKILDFIYPNYMKIKNYYKKKYKRKQISK